MKKEVALFLYVPSFMIIVFLFSLNTTYAGHVQVQEINCTQSRTPETKQQLNALPYRSCSPFVRPSGNIGNSEAPAGTYLLKIKDGNSQITQKLIKLNK